MKSTHLTVAHASSDPLNVRERDIEFVGAKCVSERERERWYTLPGRLCDCTKIMEPKCRKEEREGE